MNLVILRGGGDIATGIAHRLHMAGFKVVILEIEKPLSIRREVSFSEAIYRGEIIVENVKAIRAKNIDDIFKILEEKHIPVIVDEFGKLIPFLKPIAVVDCILAKRNLGTSKNMAPITIGIGPGFNASEDVHLVVETIRGHNLGKVIYKGEAEKNTGIPESVMNYGNERVLRATTDGIINNHCQIGDIVDNDAPIIRIGEEYIRAKISGVVRGLIKDGTIATKGLKIADIDPRGIREYAFTISDKARAVGGGVLEGIMHLIGEVK